MIKTYLPYEPDQQLLLPAALQEWLPDDHLAYFISDVVGQLDMSKVTARYERERRGGPPYHPRMMVKVLLYGYYIAYAHMIRVIDGGVSIEPLNDQLHSAHWRAHLVGPQLQCMRCLGQYNSSDVSMELDGSLDNPSYIENLPPEEQPNNRNVFPFGLSVSAMEVNLMLRHLLAQDWWPVVQQQDYQFVRGDVCITQGKCYGSCEFPRRVAMGDYEAPFYLVDVPSPALLSPIYTLGPMFRWIRRLLRHDRH